MFGAVEVYVVYQWFVSVGCACVLLKSLVTFWTHVDGRFSVASFAPF